MSKVFETAAQLKKHLKTLTDSRIVLVNGVFDLIHPGHVNLLREASHLGTHLVVAVNADSTVAKLKGPTRPILSYAERVQVLESLASVDFIVPFLEDSPAEVLRKIRPDVYVKSSEYIGKQVDEADVGKVKVVNMIPGISTTELIRRILDKEAGF